jgi:hypothetical protein
MTSTQLTSRSGRRTQKLTVPPLVEKFAVFFMELEDSQPVTVTVNRNRTHLSSHNVTTSTHLHFLFFPGATTYDVEYA